MIETTTCCCNPCTSTELGIEPDMRLGDTCILCCCRECERCGTSIDLDCENQIKAGKHIEAGYADICDACLLDTDILYDDELEAERREGTHR